MRRTTLADVAAEVGVSSKTVSNVIRGTGWVSDPVRKRVQRAIEELGYKPNMAARQLRGGHSGLVALCIPSLREPYFAEFAAEFVDRAEARGVTVLVTQSRGKRWRERELLNGEKLPAIDGMVLSPIELTAEDIETRESTFPVILIGEHGATLPLKDVAHLGSDNIAAAKVATESLLVQGRRRIAAVGLEEGESSGATAAVRFKGYRQALEERGLAVDPELLVVVDDYNRAEGSRAIQSLIDRGVEFDGVFCFNDSLALGALHTLSSHGLAVPGDVAVVGFDNIEEAQYTTPPLPSIDPGVAASSSQMLALLAGPKENVTGRFTAPFTLVSR